MGTPRSGSPTAVFCLPPFVRLLLLMSGLLVSVLTCRGAWGGDKDYDAADTALETVRLQLNCKHRFRFAGFYAAIERGYYRKAGFIVEPIEGRSGLDTIDAVVNGRATFGVAGSDILLAWMHGKPVVVLAAIFQHSPRVFITRDADGIATPHDLVGKQIRVPSERLSTELLAMLVNEGVFPQTLDIRYRPPYPKDCLDPAIGALSMDETQGPFHFIEQGVPYRILRPAGYGVDFYGDCLFTGETQIEKRPARVQAFREASLKGWQWALSNPEEMVRIIRNRYDRRSTPDQLRYEADITKRLVRPGVIELGHMNPGRWRQIAEIYAQLGLADKTSDIDGFVYDPDPSRNTRWLVRVALVGVFGAAAAALAAAVCLIINRRLRREIERRIQAEAALSESDRRYRAIVEEQTELICRYRPDGTLTLANKACGRYLGQPTSELVGRPFLPGMTEKELRYARDRLATLTPTHPEITTEHRLSLPDGTPRWLRWTHRAIFDETGNIAEVQAIGRDVTDLETAMNALSESRRQLQEIAAGIPGAVYQFVMAPDGTFHLPFINEGVQKLYEIPPAFFTEDIERMFDMIHPDDLEAVRTSMLRSAANLSPWLEEFRIVLPDRSIRWLRGGSLPHRAADGSTVWNGMFFDISDLKNAEAALAESDRRHRSIYHNTPAMMHSTDETGYIISVSDHWLEVMGYRREEVIGRKNTAFLTPESRKYVEEIGFPQFLKTGRSKNVPLQFVTKSGRVIDVLLSSVIERSPDGSFLQTLAVIVDVTDRKALENELLNTRKLESVGILAGGIAHDYNNLLAVVLGNVSLARSDLPADDPVGPILLEIEKAAVKARDLTRKLITFSRGGDPVKKPVVMKDLVRTTTELALSGTNVTAQFSLPEKLPLTEIDPGQIRQVIQNVVTNAVEAMPEGGTIAVTAAVKPVAAGAFPGLAPGLHVEINVADKGAGISEPHMDQIFDPYFSTKEKGVHKGMGLGLAMAHSIIRQHRGHIHIESKEGEGSRVSILLPAAAETAKAVEGPPEAPVSGTREQRVLVMDDEEMIRDLSTRMLNRLGIEAHTVDDGQAAIDAYLKALESGTRFDLVILDLTVRGGLGGLSAMKTLKSIDPQIKAVVSSGHASDPALSDYRSHGFCGAIRKPYTVKEMGDLLKAVLSPLP